MLDICDYQLLVLLLVMQAKRHDGREFRKLSPIELLQQTKHMFINVAAILVGLFHRRPRDQATLGPTMPFSERVVIGIEEIGILRMKRLVTRKSRGEHKG